jgi:predicted unusual protein kinase regulating ubiquinone biosynthesis (AarF/ABC1/UbiB family)
LDFAIDLAHRHQYVDVLLRLSRASRLYPESFILKGIEILGHPVAAGGFADVYKGRLRGQEIAIKVLRVYQKTDVDTLLKVA